MGSPYPYLSPKLFAVSLPRAGASGDDEKWQRPVETESNWELEYLVPFPVSPYRVARGPLPSPRPYWPHSCLTHPPRPKIPGEHSGRRACATWRPFWGTARCAHPPVLHAHCQHDGYVDLLLPHRPPEVLQGFLESPWVAVKSCGWAYPSRGGAQEHVNWWSLGPQSPTGRWQ